MKKCIKQLKDVNEIRKLFRFFNFLKEKMIFVVYINNGGRNNGNKNQT